MKRHEKRQEERNKKKAKKQKNTDTMMTSLAKYGNSLKEFHDAGKGNILEWLLSLDTQDLHVLTGGIGDEDTENSAITTFITMNAYCLQTGSNNFVDENPDTEDSTVYKMVNFFIHIASAALLKKSGLADVKLEGEGFFNPKAQEIGVKIKEREDIPTSCLKLYDFAVQNEIMDEE